MADAAVTLGGPPASSDRIGISMTVEHWHRHWHWHWLRLWLWHKLWHAIGPSVGTVASPAPSCHVANTCASQLGCMACLDGRATRLTSHRNTGGRPDVTSTARNRDALRRTGQAQIAPATPCHSLIARRQSPRRAQTQLATFARAAFLDKVARYPSSGRVCSPAASCFGLLRPAAPAARSLLHQLGLCGSRPYTSSRLREPPIAPHHQSLARMHDDGRAWALLPLPTTTIEPRPPPPCSMLPPLPPSLHQRACFGPAVRVPGMMHEC